jgi:hypothetical protein
VKEDATEERAAVTHRHPKERPSVRPIATPSGPGIPHDVALGQDELVPLVPEHLGSDLGGRRGPVAAVSQAVNLPVLIDGYGRSPGRPGERSHLIEDGVEQGRRIEVFSELKSDLDERPRKVFLSLTLQSAPPASLVTLADVIGAKPRNANEEDQLEPGDNRYDPSP